MASAPEIDPDALLPDHGGAKLREAQLSNALDTIRKAIETIEPGSLPAAATKRRPLSSGSHRACRRGRDDVGAS
jgi:hypothetical protein